LDFLGDLEPRLAREIGFRLAGVEPVHPGVIHNNRLFRLQSADGRAAMAKLYLQDGRFRLEREYDALAVLRSHGITSVPSPLARSDEHYYAVYSLEAGENRPAAQWTTAHSTASAHFCIQLDRIRPEDVHVPLRDAFAAAFSLSESVTRTRARLSLFTTYASSLGGAADSPPEIAGLLASIDPAAEIERLIAAAMRGVSPDAMDARVPDRRRRLDVGDFAPHNVLIRPTGYPDGTICVLDLEYAGWDDPVAMCALFATADQSLGMPPALLEAMLRVFQDGVDLVAEERERMERVMALMHVAWCAIHLQLLVPELIEKKRFASPDLDVTTHRMDQIATFHRRLAIARAAMTRLT